MKKVLVLGLALALMGGVAYANFCARDYVPAATLLIPYVAVEVDANGAPISTGKTTITGITNTSQEAIIIHFTVWDALSNPEVDFNEILSGYDVLQINWRDFLNAQFSLFDTSQTKFTAGTKTFDPYEFGPDGRLNTAGLNAPQNRNAITTAQCEPGNSELVSPPYNDQPTLAGVIQGKLNDVLFAYDHAGCPNPTVREIRTDKTSWTTSLDINPTFFYVTADVVGKCSRNFPNEDAYWATDTLRTDNVIIGDVIYLDSVNKFSEMYPAVSIEASLSWPLTSLPHPFYVDATDLNTYREPLATAFAFRYGEVTTGPLPIATTLILWKNFSEFITLSHVDYVEDCSAYLYYAWDMDERSLSRQTFPISGLPTGGPDLNQFPFETQRVTINLAQFDLPDAMGWFLLVLPPSYGFTPADHNTNYNLYMGWAGMQFQFGGYSAGSEAATLANAHCFNWQTLNGLNTNTGSTLVDTWHPQPLMTP